MPKKSKEKPVTASRDVIMGDQHNHYADLSRLEKTAEEIKTLLCESQSRIQISGDVQGSVIVQGNHNNIPISRGEIELLGTLQSRAKSKQREEF